MNDLKQVKEKHISVSPEFPDMDVAQFKACVTCTATLDRDQVPSLSSSNGFTYHPYPTQSYWRVTLTSTWKIITMPNL
jgi:hypothetical protein